MAQYSKRSLYILYKTKIYVLRLNISDTYVINLFLAKRVFLQGNAQFKY